MLDSTCDVRFTLRGKGVPVKRQINFGCLWHQAEAHPNFGEQGVTRNALKSAVAGVESRTSGVSDVSQLYIRYEWRFALPLSTAPQSS